MTKKNFVKLLIQNKQRGEEILFAQTIKLKILHQ